MNSIISGVTLIYYLRAAWTNPGYIMGSVYDAATRAGAYDPKHYALGDNNTSINPNG